MEIPNEIDILPLFDTVVYPLAVIPLALSQPASVRLLDTMTGESRLIGVVALRTEDQRPDPIHPDDCYRIGTAALVHRLLRLPDHTLRVAVQGIERIEIVEFLPGQSWLRARIRLLPEPDDDDHNAIATLMQTLVAQTHQVARIIPNFNEELLNQISAEEDPRRLVYLVATATLLRRRVAERQRVLELPDIYARMRYLSQVLTTDIEALRPRRQEPGHAEPHVAVEASPAPAAAPTADQPKPETAAVPYAARPGSVLFLRWTPQGGECAIVEAVQMPGNKGFLLTGQRGDLLHDTASVALSWVRSRAVQLGLLTHFFEQIDLHVHIPPGMSAEDHPAVGIAIATALVSLLTERPVADTLALAGELTLHGRVLPIGRAREKVLAAYRTGITTFVLPARNQADLALLPEDVQRELTFIFVDTMDQVLAAALLEKPEGRSS